MNNPILNMMKNGNPMAVAQQIARNNPQMAQALRMVQGKNEQQLMQMAQNMARERGTSVEAIARSLGLQ